MYYACMLHQVDLVVSRVCKAHNQKVVSLLWSLSNWFSTGNFWLRFILSIDVMKHSHFKIEYRDPDPDDLLHRELVARFFRPEVHTRGSTEITQGRSEMASRVLVHVQRPADDARQFFHEVGAPLPFWLRLLV